MSTPAQIRTIHALKNQARLCDDDYRALLKREINVASSKDASEAQANRLIAALTKLAPPKAKRETLKGHYAKILQALWIEAYKAGALSDRTDKALLAFVKNQTGKEAIQFLDNSEASQLIEALKIMANRNHNAKLKRRKA